MSNDVVVITDKPLTASEIKANVNLIQAVMQAVMKEGTHYGKIPGCQQPSLYKPGSEKILSTFQIAVEPHVEDLSTADERRYRVICNGKSMKTGAYLGGGVGECSTSEEKYKWRKAASQKEYEATPEDRRRIKYYKDSEVQQVRTEPADLANTVLKMAKKRAQIDMTLTITAASDIFSQDLEDMPEGIDENGHGTTATRKADTVKTKTDQPRPVSGEETNVKAKLKSELATYCNGNVKKMEEVLKECSIFGDPGKERWIKGLSDIDKTSDKWCSSTLGSLRKLAEEQPTPPGAAPAGLPEGCMKMPMQCEHSSWTSDNEPLCTKQNNAPCPFSVQVE